jgi:DNA-binding PadR family transcriptional regulator
MMTKLISEKTMRFLASMLDLGNSVTFKTQKFFKNRLSYYMMVQHLRDMGFVSESKVRNSNEKIYILTQKGERVANLFKNLLVELKELIK